MPNIRSIAKRIFPQKPNYKKASYAQTGEDLIVRFLFDELQISRPSYIDIGAHHPFFLSNTALFYRSGCRGINIEPDPTLFGAFTKHRPNDTNLNMGIGAEAAEADFYIISSPTLNTFSKKEAEAYKNEGDYYITQTLKMPINTISYVVDKYNSGVFPQYLNLDAEGVDELIVRSIDYEKNYPLVMCIETISFSTSGNGVKNNALIDFVKEKGYMVYADTYMNTIFVRSEAFRNTRG